MYNYIPSYQYISNVAYSVYTKYCFWVWIWTILFMKGYVSISPLPSSVFGTIFTVFNSILNPYNSASIMRISIFMFLELFFVALNIKIRHNVTVKETFYNGIVFIIYLGIISFFGLSFKKLYLAGLLENL